MVSCEAMAPSRMRYVAVFLRSLVAAACILLAWTAINLLRADFYARQDTPDSLRKAISLAPDAPAYYLRLSQLDPDHGGPLLEQAIRLNPYNAMIDIELGLRYEAAGDYARAEQRLLAAFAIDRTYVPRWSLANFYFRRDNQAEFWKWVRLAAEMPSDDITPLFQLCWHATSDPGKIADTVLENKPDLMHQYIAFLIGKNDLAGASTIAAQLLQYGDPRVDRPLLFGLIYKLLLQKEAGPPKTLWDSMIAHQWIAEDHGIPYNGNFSRDPFNVPFDWVIATSPGMHSWVGDSGLNADFDGDEPENCWVVSQDLVLAPGRYKVQFVYQTSGIPPGSGLRWTVENVKTTASLASSADLSSQNSQQQSFDLVVPADSPLVQLRLTYQRALGTTPISGKVVVSSVQISSA